MSLWSHGNDREVYRAQHLFCHGAEEQLAYLAPAPSPEKDAVCLELTCSGNDLLSRMAFANDCIAWNRLRASHRPPGLECLDGEVDCSRRIVIRHANRIGSNARPCAEDMKENDPGFRFLCLVERKGHQPVQIAEVCRDEDDGGMGPSTWSHVRHDSHPLRKEVRTSGWDEMCHGARRFVRWITGRRPPLKRSSFLFVGVDWLEQGVCRSRPVYRSTICNRSLAASPDRQSYVVDPLVKWSAAGVLIQLKLNADHILPGGTAEVPALVEPVRFPIEDQRVVAILCGTDALEVPLN